MQAAFETRVSAMRFDRTIQDSKRLPGVRSSSAHENRRFFQSGLAVHAMMPQVLTCHFGIWASRPEAHLTKLCRVTDE